MNIEEQIKDIFGYKEVGKYPKENATDNEDRPIVITGKMTREELIQDLSNLLTKSNEEAVKEFVAWLKLSSDVFYHEPSLQSLLTKEMETYLQSLDGGDKE